MNISRDLIAFQFEAHDVRVHVDDQGNPWWEAQDVCAILDIQDVSKAVARLRLGEKRTSESRNVLIINESGLYRLIFRSNKPDAEKFQDWVFEVVLPAIRTTGKYEAASALDHFPELRAIVELAQSTAEARLLAQEAKAEAAEANANAVRALESQLFYTVAEYVYSNKLQAQLPQSGYRACSDHLRLYCMDNRIPFRKIPVGGQRWSEEYAYHVHVYSEVLPGWLTRRHSQIALVSPIQPSSQ
jgi:prophage antirepressor-like protein